MKSAGTNPPIEDPARRVREARRADPLAPELVNLLSFFASRPLPVDLLSRFAERVPGRLSTGSADPTRIRRVLDQLIRIGALASGDGGVYLPDALQAVAREDLVTPQAAGYADAALRILEGMDEEVDAGGDQGPDAVRREVLLPHAPAVAERLVELGRAPDRALVLGARAVEAAGRDAPHGVEMAERMATIARESGRLRDPFLLAALLDQLAELQAARDREEEAMGTLREAVSLVEEVCPRDDPRRAVVLHNGGDLARRLGRVAEAATLLERCLTLLDEQEGEGGEALRARTSLDLAEARLADGPPDAAAEAARDATETCRRSLGGVHPETAAAWSLWGRALHRGDHLPEAAACFRRALAALSESYGSDHPALGADLGNLAETLEGLGQGDAARRCHRRALRIFRKAYGPEHHLVRAARRRAEGT